MTMRRKASEEERSRDKRNRRNSVKSKFGARFKSLASASKSGSSVGFGQSQRSVEFRPDAGQLLINPAPEKKAAVYRCFGCGKAGYFLKDCRVATTTSK